MRTTLTVDDDLIDLAKRRAVEGHATLGQVVNRALRIGLMAEAPRRVAEATVVYGDPRTLGPDDVTLRTLAAEFDDAELRRKLEP